jgi:hypothetical protein
MESGRAGATPPLQLVPAVRRDVAPITPVTPGVAVSATAAAARGATGTTEGTGAALVSRSTDSTVARHGAESLADLAVALERARAGLVTLDGAAILDALDTVWAIEQAPPSAWYLRAAALALLDAPTEAEGIVLLGLERWPADDALSMGRIITMVSRGASSEAAPLLEQLAQRRPDGPWDVIRAALQTARADHASRDAVPGSAAADEQQVERPLAHRAPSPMLLALAHTLRTGSSATLAEQAMAMARATSLGGEGGADRHALRKLVAAVFVQLSREGGASAAPAPEFGFEAVVAALRAREVQSARAVVARMPPSPQREVAAALVEASVHADSASERESVSASEPESVSASESLSESETVSPPQSERAERASASSDGQPSVRVGERDVPATLRLWRDGLRLLDPPDVEATRAPGLRRRRDAGGAAAATGWTMLPPTPRPTRWVPSARWGSIVAVLVVLATLSRCAVR